MDGGERLEEGRELPRVGGLLPLALLLEGAESRLDLGEGGERVVLPDEEGAPLAERVLEDDLGPELPGRPGAGLGLVPEEVLPSTATLKNESASSFSRERRKRFSSMARATSRTQAVPEPETATAVPPIEE